MKKTFAIRLEDDVLKCLSLSSRLTHTPVARLINPFIEEGTKIILGSLLLLMVDREAVIERRAVEDLIHSALGDPGEEVATVPMIISRMEEIMGRKGVIKEMERIFPGVSFRPGRGVSVRGDLKTLLLRMGEDYLKRGGSTKKLQMDLGVRVFMGSFLRVYYRRNARGTLEDLKDAWSRGGRLVESLAERIYGIYSSEIELTPIEAIEIGEFSTGSSR